MARVLPRRWRVSDRCPCCGRAYPKAGRPKYATHEERKAGAKAAREATVRRHFERDAAVRAKLPNVFGTRDIGEACVAVGRHWSDFQAVLQRGLKFGAFEQIDSVPAGRVFHRRFMKVPEVPDMKVPEVPDAT